LSQEEEEEELPRFGIPIRDVRAQAHAGERPIFSSGFGDSGMDDAWRH